jgi:two-component system sensor histidine kinase UhpB
MQPGHVLAASEPAVGRDRIDVPQEDLRVLMVEDSAADAELVLHELRRAGYAPDAVIVDSGKELAAALSRREWSVIISDHSLPGFTATEALHAATEQAPETPFIIVSGTVGEEAVVEALKAGARDCVMKGNLARLGPVVRRELEEADTRRRRRAAEQALRRSEERFRRLAENALDIIFEYRLHPVRGFAYLSPAATAITGYTPEEHYRDPDLWDKLVHPDDREVLRRQLVAPTSDAMELRWVRNDGSVIWTEQRVVGVRDASGRLVAVEGIARDVSDRKRAEDALRHADQARRRLLAGLVSAQEEERSRIAADIHDDSVQVLTALALQLDIIAAKITDTRLEATVRRAAETTRVSLERLRKLIFDLRPPILDEAGLAVALNAYLDQTTAQQNVAFTLSDHLELEPDPSTRTIIYRITQEAVANGLKHAHPTTIDVSLRQTDDGILTTIHDDGAGFTVAEADHRLRPGHLGLVSMRERAELAGGWFRIDSQPGRGTTVELLIPRAAQPVFDSAANEPPPVATEQSAPTRPRPR